MADDSKVTKVVETAPFDVVDIKQEPVDVSIVFFLAFILGIVCK